MEPVEVTEILLNEKDLPVTQARNNASNIEEIKDWKYYGAIKGKWVENKRQTILPAGEEWILPLDPNIKIYPVIGENVVCANYLGRTFYTTIINFHNNPNNSIVAGLSSEQEDVMSEVAFSHRTIHYQNDANQHLPIIARDGDIVFQGRYGNSIKIGSHQRVNSSIKLVAGHSSDRTYDLKKDSASIYVDDGGSVELINPVKVDKRARKPKTYTVSGKKIILDADVIVLNAKAEIRLVSGELLDMQSKVIETKHNVDPVTAEPGQIYYGETNELLENLRAKPRKAVEREINKCIEAFDQLLDKPTEEWEKLQKLMEKLNKMNWEKPGRQLLDKIKDIQMTVEFPVYNELVEDWRRIMSKFQDDTDIINQQVPNIPPGNPRAGQWADPVGRIMIYKDLVEVIRDFSTLSFMRPDIVTNKRPK